MPLLRLLEGSDEGTRARTLDVLAALNDDVAVNTLLDRMNRETVPELRARMAETIAATGKRNAILALMNLILDPKDATLKHRVLDQVAALPGMTARELLLEMGDLEQDPETIDRIDQLLAMVEET
jgi:HEAT repeat protein